MYYIESEKYEIESHTLSVFDNHDAGVIRKEKGLHI